MHIAQQHSARSQQLQKSKWQHLLLNIPIAQRLAFGFLIPAIMAAIALGSIGVHSQQLTGARVIILPIAGGGLYRAE